MARVINFSIEVTDEEMKNFLARMSGAEGRKIESDVEVESTPVTDEPAVEWDERFHASSKAVNADGTWRRKRGLTPEETAAADAYEKGEEVAPTPEPAPADAPTPEPAPVAPTLPTMPGLPAAPAPAPEPVSYEELVKLFGEATAKDASVSANFAELYAKAGVTDPQALTSDEGADKRLALANLLREIING